MHATQFVTESEEEAKPLVESAELLALEGAQIDRKKRKRQDQLDEVRAEMKDWKKRAILFSQENEMSNLTLNLTPEQLDEFGETGCFEIKRDYEIEGLNQDHLLYLFTEFYKNLYPNQNLEEIQNLSAFQLKWMWSHRRTSQLTTIRRIGSRKPPKPRTGAPRKCQPIVSPNIPRTMEEFRQLPIVQTMIGQ